MVVEKPTARRSSMAFFLAFAVAGFRPNAQHYVLSLTIPLPQSATTSHRSFQSTRPCGSICHGASTSLFMVDSDSSNNSSSDSSIDVEAATNGVVLNATTGLINGNEVPQPIEKDEEDQPATFTPRPPEQVPDQSLLSKEYDALKEQRDQTAFVIDELSSRALELQDQLKVKKKELEESQSEWSMEKSSFLRKIAELTGLIEEKQELNEEERYRQEKLESEVQLLQSQIVQVQMALKREQKASEELRDRLSDVEDAMEFDQMSFEKERKELEKQLKEEKQRLESLQSQWDADKERFESERSMVQEQLDAERDRLKKAQLEWAENKFEYEEQQSTLQQMLEEQKKRLADTEALVESEREQFGEEREALKSVIQADRLKLSEIEQALEEEKATFLSVQADLEARILDEQDKVDALYIRLQQEQERFYLEKDNLEISLQLERKRVERVEADLARDRIEFESEKSKLQEEIDEQVRLNRLKKKQMAKRYEAIRSQLTDLWEGAKRDAREERKKLTAKYEGRLMNMSQKVSELESNLLNAQRASDELATVLTELQIQKERARDETQMVETRYITMISQRNREIAGLKVGMNELKDTVAQREAQLEKYESSFRELLRLGVKVTGKKLKNGRTRVSGWFRRGNKDIY